MLALLTLANIAVLFVSAGVVVERASWLGVHGFSGIVIHVFSGLLAVALGVRTWLTRTGVIPAVLAGLLFVLTFPQAAAGSYATMTLHISGSLVLTLLAAWLTAWTFGLRRPVRSTP